MNSFRKILLVSGLLFLFCLLQQESKKEDLFIFQKENNASFDQNKIHDSYCIQPTTIVTSAIENNIHSSFFDWHAILALPLFIINNTYATAVKAFTQKSINYIAAVSFLLFPVHYFW
jgi:hypothetical protein